MPDETLTIRDNRTGTEVEIPITDGTIRATDLRQLGLMSYDPAFLNTASTRSAITYIDGDAGILRYRGYPIEQLAEHASFLETAWLLFEGELPTAAELEAWEDEVRLHTYVHTNVTQFLDGFRHDAHPMGMLLGAVAALSTFYPDAKEIGDVESRRLQRLRLIAKFPTIAAWVFRHSRGLPYVFPRNDLDYIGNFVNMTFEIGGRHEPNPVLQRALEILLVLHADHEQNASTNAVRGVGSTQVDPFSAVSAGVAALYGPLHGGANEAVLKMLDEIGTVERVPEFIESVKAGHGRLMGFGHRVYKSYDPRAKLIKRVADDVFAETGLNPKLEIALELERIALEDDYFISRKLYPNVDFYSGLIYQAMGYPDRLLHGAVRSRPPARLARAVGGDALRPRAEDRAAAPGLHGLRRARLRPARQRALAASCTFPSRRPGRTCARARSSRRRRRRLRSTHVSRLFIERSSVPSGETAAKVVNALTAATSSPGCVADLVEGNLHDLVVRERAEPLRHHRAQCVLAVVRPALPEIEGADVVGVEVEERVDVLRPHGGGIRAQHLVHFESPFVGVVLTTPRRTQTQRRAPLAPPKRERAVRARRAPARSCSARRGPRTTETRVVGEEPRERERGGSPRRSSSSSAS